MVGGGFAGMSAAVRLAKLQHEVIVLEASDRLGGQLNGIARDGIVWQIHPDAVTLPGVFRDLFRKSGRQLDRELDLTPIYGRRHFFKDRSSFDLPLGKRGDQVEAITQAFSSDPWSDWVDSQADVWDAIRRVALDRVLVGRNDFGADQWKSLRARRPIGKITRKDITDERLVKVILDPVSLQGDDRRVTPGFAAVSHYVERNFGLWTFSGGHPALAKALIKRCAERKIDIRYGVHVTDVAHENGRVRAALAGTDPIDADYLVWAAPSWPVSVPPCRELPRIPSARVHLVLDPAAPDLAPEIAVHSNPPIRMWTSAPGQWTIAHRGGEDPVIAMVRCGLDLRDYIVDRWDQSPVDLVTLGHWGWVWQGWSTAFNRPGIDPQGGLYFAGAHAHPGTSLELIGMATAAIAGHIGKA